eukprot:476696-Rhodomonas_salina.2
MVGTDIACLVLKSRMLLPAWTVWRQSSCAGSATPRNQIQETAASVQFVPVMRVLVFDFGMYAATRFLCDARY